MMHQIGYYILCFSKPMEIIKVSHILCNETKILSTYIN